MIYLSINDIQQLINRGIITKPHHPQPTNKTGFALEAFLSTVANHELLNHIQAE